jgi:acyl-CoA thioesterase FadM
MGASGGQVVPVRIERPFRVRFDECGADGFARASSYLRWAQDVAWVHSESAGFDRDWYASRGLVWLVRCLRLDLAGSVPSGRTVIVSTEVVGWRRVWARRVSEVRLARPSGGSQPDRPGGPTEAAAEPTEGSGDLIATVRTDWVLLGPNGAPTRVPDVISDAFAVELPGFEPGRVPPLSTATEGGDTPSRLSERTFRVRPQELDPLGHVNHAVYLDWLEESVAVGGGQSELGQLPRRYRIEYVRPAEPDVGLRSTTWPVDGGWAHRLATDGTELSRGLLEGQVAQGAARRRLALRLSRRVRTAS